MLGVNLRGAFNVLRAVAPPMEAGRGGSIVFTSSSAGLRGVTHMAHHTASKFGVVAPYYPRSDGGAEGRF